MNDRTSAATSSRPNRILVALAAAWMALALAIGGVVNAGDSAADSAGASVTESAQR
jgi:hypothetical protein